MTCDQCQPIPDCPHPWCPYKVAGGPESPLQRDLAALAPYFAAVHDGRWAALRRALRLTQAQLGRRMGITGRRYRDLEAGKVPRRQMPCLALERVLITAANQGQLGPLLEINNVADQSTASPSSSDGSST